MKINFKKILAWTIPALVMSVPMAVLAQFGGVQPYDGTAQMPLPQAVRNMINIFLILAGLVGSIFLIIGGVRYITSGGDSQGQESAKNTILYSLIGLIVIGLAAAIANFVIGAIQAS